MKLSTAQLTDAKRLHGDGVSWSIIASYLNTNTTKLRQEVKTYDQSNTT